MRVQIGGPVGGEYAATSLLEVPNGWLSKQLFLHKVGVLSSRLSFQLTELVAPLAADPNGLTPAQRPDLFENQTQ